MRPWCQMKSNHESLAAIRLREEASQRMTPLIELLKIARPGGLLTLVV